MAKKGDFVVVCTDKDKRGVFAGVLKSQDGDTVTLTDSRMCVYWSRETKGVVGLASIGPQDGSRVSPASPEAEIPGVTLVSLCSDEARKRWEAEPWS